jgi:ribosome biogenesis SPOUT family RNA methylase Rps3
MGGDDGGVKGAKLITMKTPYGDISYLETPEMRRAKSKK